MHGETLVWSGMPARGILLTRRDALLIPFSLLWCGFSLFWEVGVIALPNAPFFFRLWGVPFVLIGLYLVAGRFVVDAWLRGRTHYALTDRRILIDRSGPFGAFVALGLERLSATTLLESAGGRGTIRFGEQSSRVRVGFSGWTPSLDPTPQFIAIPNAQHVFAAIQHQTARHRPALS